MSYVVGQVTILEASFVDDNGDPINPSTVKVWVKDPSDVETAYVYGVDAAVIRDSTGEYHMDYELISHGKYWWRWEADGNVDGADEDPIFVRRSQFSAGA